MEAYLTLLLRNHGNNWNGFELYVKQVSSKCIPIFMFKQTVKNGIQTTIAL